MIPLKVREAFEIIGISSAGVLDQERVILRAKQNVDAGRYILFAAKEFDADSVVPRKDLAFWLPDREVLAGEYVRIYTKNGTHGKNDGDYAGVPAVFHNFYWGLNSAIWTTSNDTFLIVLAGNWSTGKVK